MDRVRTRRRTKREGAIDGEEKSGMGLGTILLRWGAPFEAQGEAVRACRRLAVPLQDLGRGVIPCTAGSGYCAGLSYGAHVRVAVSARLVTTRLLGGGGVAAD
jgi:hypothetical protein